MNEDFGLFRIEKTMYILRRRVADGSNPPMINKGIVTWFSSLDRYLAFDAKLKDNNISLPGLVFADPSTGFGKILQATRAAQTIGATLVALDPEGIETRPIAIEAFKQHLKVLMDESSHGAYWYECESCGQGSDLQTPHLPGVFSWTCGACGHGNQGQMPSAPPKS